MFFHEDSVDNFFVHINSEPTALYPNNNKDTFAVAFPHQKDFSINEAWEVAVTSMTIPYWITNPISPYITNSISIKLRLDRGEAKVEKMVHIPNGYYTTRRDYVNVIKLLHPIYVFKDEQDQSINTIDFDDYLEWDVSSTTNQVRLDTNAIFSEYPNGFLRIFFASSVRHALQIMTHVNVLKGDEPKDTHILHSVTSGRYSGRDGVHFTHKHQVLVHSNLTDSSENPQKIIFHSSEINNPQNHTSCGTVNLVPDRLEYHKVTSENFSHMNFNITDSKGENFNWLHDIPVTLGLHFRKRYYINVYK